MKYEEFEQMTISFWDRYLSFITNEYQRGNIKFLKNKTRLLFPSILIFTKTKKFFIAELFGANKEFKGLTVKQHFKSKTSIQEYFNQFGGIIKNNEKKVYQIIFGGRQTASGMAFVNCHTGVEAAEKRFPFLENYKSKIVGLPRFNQKSSVSFNNSILVNRHHSAIRVKHILNIILISKTTSNAKFKDLLRFVFQEGDKQAEVCGVHACGSEEIEARYSIASQFSNIYFFNRLHETTIGAFINHHPEIIHKAFNTSSFIYEPILEWKQGKEHNDEKYINPDLLIKRDDGYYDICDIKTAALTKNNITKGKSKRRRFIDYVYEGLSQLANYEDYFNFPQNRQHAIETLGVRVKNPKLILIVGNYDNVNSNEIKEASRIHRNCEIIDYESLMNLYLYS